MHRSSSIIPVAFIWRRLHSLTGLWLVAFLVIHLLANSQAALFIGDDASGFVKAVNDIRALPYLPMIEILLLAVPFAIHMIWGVQYLFTGKYNSFSSDGTTPSLNYPRNQAYTWQRITSWILLFLITAHVIHMRFLEAPAQAAIGPNKYYIVKVESDPGIYTISERLGVQLYDAEQIAKEQARFKQRRIPEGEDPEALVEQQRYHQQENWTKALQSETLSSGELMAVAPSFGVSELLMVRETFKMPIMLILYTVLVLSACFHAFNGLWTFMITWGVTLSVHSQNVMRIIAWGLMGLIAFLGLAAIWGTYWINLRQ